MSWSQEQFELKYKKGQSAFEQGRYRLSIDNLEQAYQLVSPNTRLGGEVKMWLVNAYQAIGDSEKAIELCQDLLTHPHRETKKKAQQMLYIIRAPKLKRPREWMTEIPDLNELSEQNKKYQPLQVVNNNQKIEPKRQIELVDLSTVNNQDNNFLVMTLLIAVLTLFGLFIL